MSSRKLHVVLAIVSLPALVVLAARAGPATGTPPFHVSVAGAEDAGVVSRGDATQRGRVLERRGSTWSGVDASADPRVRGRFSVVLHENEYPDGRIDFWADHALRNAGGTWRGPGFGFRDAAGSHHVFSVNRGTGTYAGLTYYLLVLDYRSGTATEHTFQTLGWIDRRATRIEPSSLRGHVRASAKAQAKRTAAGTATVGEGRTYVDGSVWSGRSATRDERLAGTQRLVLDMVAYPDGRQDAWGTYTLRNARGSWRGRLWGFRTPDGRSVRFVDATGTAAYAGLRFRAVARSSAAATATNQSWTLDGWIEPTG